MKSVDLSTDILAVRSIGDHVFIGMGCTLYLLRKSDGKLELKIDVLHPDNIYGIVIKPKNRLIVFGGRSLCMFELNITNNSVQLEKLYDVHRLPDWIISVECLESKDDTLSILFAHNNVYTYNISTKEYTDSRCQEKCLLYGGTVSGSSSNTAVIFSGTVFQEILIWRVKNGEDSPVLHRLKGHNGVIFSVFYSPTKKLICSTSDDRTVRLWRISNLNFDNNELEWEKVNIALQTTMFGHVARVWESMIVNDMIISIGEDSKICTWTLEGKLLNKIEAHQGAPIWCLDVTEDDTILTGGSDGAVNSWPLRYDSNNVRYQTLLVTTNGSAVPKNVYHLNEDIVLVLKEDGMLLWFAENEKLKGSQNLSKSSSSYCILQVSSDKTQLVTASIKGEISLYKKIDDNDTQPMHWKYKGSWTAVNSKIFSMQWLSNDSLLICGAEGVLHICKFGKHGSLDIQSKYILPMSRERWVTTAVIFGNALVCGDRIGNIFVFKTTNVGTNENTQNNGPVQTFNKIHGRLGVQSLLIMGSKLLTTGRDGTLRFFRIRNSREENSTIEYMHKRYMPMDWVSKVLKYREEYLILGFKEVDFVVYSLTLRRFLVRINCGGARRSWDCIVHNNILKFVYVREKEVHSVTVSLQPLILPPLLTGLHSKEIYCIQRIPVDNCKNLILFGGEDCSLRIGSISPVSNNEATLHKNLDLFDGHISNIKTISIINIESTNSISKNLIVTAGGRAQLKVWEIDVKLTQNIVTRDDVSCKDVLSNMLRGPDMQRKKIKKGDELMYDMDPETRYMDLSLLKSPQNSNDIIVFVACSDGYLRIMEYNTKLTEIRLMKAIPYRNRCILKVHSFEYHGSIVVITMATDGLVHFWNFKFIDEEIVLCNIHLDASDNWKVHQSGINSFDIKVLKDDHFLFATGGDDNLLSLILFKITKIPNDEPNVTIVSRWETAAVHYAQITGIKFIGENKLYSVGADQILAIHSYLYASQLHVDLYNTSILTIPDIQGITHLQSDDPTKELFCAYGKGFQIIQL